MCLQAEIRKGTLEYEIMAIESTLPPPDDKTHHWLRIFNPVVGG